jgi:long-subunit fatty acid transport protein
VPARVTLVLLVAVGVLAASPPVRAYPLLPLRPVPDAIAGPADAHPAAAYYNPGALGFQRGLHLFVDGGARAFAGSLQRDGSGGSAPIAWANLDSFIGLSWDLGTDSFVLGLAVYTPFTEISSYPRDSVARFHERSQTFISLEQTFAAAWKIESHVSIGAGLIVDENWLDYRFARDLAPAGGSALVSQPNSVCGGMPCGYENALAEQQIRLHGYATGIGFVVGVLIRPVERVFIGVSYSSHQTGGDLFLSDNRRARVSPAPGQGAPCGSSACGGDDRVVMALPDMIQAALRLQLTPRLELEASWRFVHYGARTALDVNLQGGNLDRARVPQTFFIDRGLQNSYLVGVSSRHVISPALRLSPSLMFETAAVAPSAVNPAALDAPKLDAALTLEWKAWRFAGDRAILIGAHVGLTAFFVHHVASRYDARLETGCVDAAYSLYSCAALNSGSALPSASGDYTFVNVHAGLAVGLSY